MAKKSVGIALEVGGDRRIVEAFRECVRESMQELERDVQTRVRKGNENASRTSKDAARVSATEALEQRPPDRSSQHDAQDRLSIGLGMMAEHSRKMRLAFNRWVGIRSRFGSTVRCWRNLHAARVPAA